MKESLALIVLLSWTSAFAHGPALGTAEDVAVTGSGMDDEKAGQICKGFNLSPSQAKVFLNKAAIVTRREIHDHYDFAPCFVHGTASFRGYPAIWEIRAGGTGSISLMSGEYISIINKEESNGPE